jgi:ribosomal protein S18 acetylase RimI-like enzyme
VLTVHRLGVHPQQQKQGVAKALMIFAAEYARTHNYTSIRLDTSCKNEPAIKLYENLNYRFAGCIDFGHGDFRCYEKVI